MTLDEILKQHEEIQSKATKGPWYLEFGVSQRGAWRIDNGIKRNEIVLNLDGIKNISLDQETNKVEENQNFITESSTAWVNTTRALRFAMERIKNDDMFYEDACYEIEKIMKGKE